MVELALRAILRQKLLGLAAIHRIRIRQRSRLIWLKVRDADSKLFHIKANGHRRRNFIPILVTEQGTLTVQADKHTTLLHHFSASLGTATPRSSTINWDFLNIEKHDLSSLDAPFIEDEVKTAVFSVPIGKAPGPDGFTASFFRHAWG